KRVQVLDKHTAELIAAGEVVERPSSIVKELLENSIDAGARAITIEIQGGGTRYIRVTDDGEGISREDVPTAFLRHATSKIRRDEDLDSIATLGFRGEALASVCAVAKVEVVTRTADEEMGTHYVIEGGEQLAYDECGCPRGTTIIVRDIFYNTPARMKFLKKDAAEGSAVAALCDRIALSHPEISIRLLREGRETLLTSGDGKLISAIYSVFGREFAKELIPVSHSTSSGTPVRVTGYISHPMTGARPNRMLQVFFINGRYCRSRTMQAALEEAFKGSIMVGKFPACVLGIEIDCAAVDVNVHPAKLEVRFTNERPVFDGVYSAVKSALSGGDTRREMVLKPQQPAADISGRATGIFAPPPKKPPVQSSILPDVPTAPEQAGTGYELLQRREPPKAAPQPAPQSSAVRPLTVRDGASPAQEFTRPVPPPVAPPVLQTVQPKREPAPADEAVPVIAEKPQTGFSAVSEAETVYSDATPAVIPDVQAQEAIPLPQEAAEETAAQTMPIGRMVGEVFETYIIIEEQDQLVLIDKHAAHERLIYEQLMENRTGTEPQMLLVPLQVTLDRTQCAALLDNAELLLQAGFEVEDFGGNTVLVRSVPMVLAESSAADAVMEIAGNLGKKKNVLITERMEQMYHTIACRSAIKAHDRSLEPELKALVERLRANPDVRFCPHGRPIFITIKKREIEKNFGRIV
ncbi:MAG: DNA mismatch repair endonuclease MutL, partial [Ruminococcaceae bacterium]|nr:DNA mismatch repair endonuclease MutL [Oscillospiraceae bacterium]